MHKFKERIRGINSVKEYFLIYTICFLATCFGVYIWFLCGKRTLIWHADGWNEYYKILVYYAQYLRSIIRALLYDHELIIPNWDFSFGEGGDVLSTIHYYVMGDPIAALSVFIPADYMYIFYNISTLLRLYIAGIVFSCLCFKVGNKSRYAVLAGTFVYLFCHWTIHFSSVHPYFLNPILYFPLLILGVEKIIRKENPLFFSATVFLAAVSNFYFFYMMVLLVIIYVVLRLASLYKGKIKKALLPLLQIGGASLLGIGISAVVFIPVCYTFLSNDRMGGLNNFRNIFYPISYYSQLVGLYLFKGSAYGLYMGFSAPVLLAVCLLFVKKGERKFLKVLLFICAVFIALPFFGQIFNGFSYMSNRWSFAVALLSAYILVAMWPSLMKINRREGVILFGCVVVYFSLCMLLEYSRTIYAFSSIVICLFFLIVILPDFPCLNRNMAGMGVILVSVLIMSFWRNSSGTGAGNTASEGVEVRNASYEALKMNEAAALKDYIETERESKGFYRYTGRNLTKNASALSQISSTQFYYSLSNPYLTQYRKELELLETGQSFCYDGYDDRLFLMALASITHYVAPAWNTAILPYGMRSVATTDVRGHRTKEAKEALKKELGVDELSEKQEADIESMSSAWWSIYENEYSLPIAYTYDSYIEEKIWETMSAVEKQEVMMQAAYLDEVPALVRVSRPEISSGKVPFKIICNSNGVSLKDNTFVVTSPKASITLKFEGLPDCETYFSIRGLEYYGVPTYELYFGDETVDPYNFYNRANWDLLTYDQQKKIKREKLFWTEPEGTGLGLQTSNGVYINMAYKTPNFSWYHDCHDFTTSFLYSEDAVTSIDISFEKAGLYKFDEMEVTCQSMDNYTGWINALKQNTEGNVVVDNDCVSGIIDVESPKILCFSIPYSDGWRAYVDGKETKLYHANIAYMAVEVDKGIHEFQLVYETPFLKEGMYISIISIVLFGVTLFLWKKNSRR